jgi:hypothetical protein
MLFRRAAGRGGRLSRSAPARQLKDPILNEPEKNASGEDRTGPEDGQPKS